MLLSIWVGTALATEPATREVSGGVVDWSAMRLEVTTSSNQSRGAWQDRRLQEQDALDQLRARITDLAEDIPITTELTAGEVMAAGGDLGERLASGLDRWAVEEARYYTRGGVELVGVLDLRVWLWPAMAELAEADEQPAPASVSGLLIDARGLEMELSMCPTLRTSSGKVLMAPVAYSDAAARRRAPALFVTDPADPKTASRIGEAPLMVRAASVDEHGALVLDAAGGARLVAEPAVSALVSRGDVVIVVDP